MTERPEILKIKYDVVTIDLPYTEGTETSNLSVAVAAAGTSLTVLDNSTLAQNDYLIIGVPGQERTEIVRITGAVTAGTALTTTAVVFPHPIDTPITLIRYNQVALFGSNEPSDLAPTAIGSVVTLDVESGRNEIVATTTYPYYYARYTNAQTGANSLYSFGVAYTGLAQNSRGKIKLSALGIANEKNSSELNEFLNDQFELCKEEIMLARRHWSFLRVTNQFKTKVLHNCNPLSSDLTTAVTASSTTIDLTSSSGWPTSGDGTIDGDTFSWTGVTDNQLTGVTGITSNHAVGTFAISPLGNGTWAIGDDAENITADNGDFREGIGSVNFDIDVSDSGNNYASIQNSAMNAVDLNDFANNGYIRLWVYIPSIIEFTNILIRWGSGTGAYWESAAIETDVYGRPLHTGWNYLETKWEDASITGAPDPQGIDFLYVRFVYTASYGDQTDARIDNISIFDKPFSITGYAPIVTIAGTQDYDLPKNIQDGNSNDSIVNVHVRNYAILEWADHEKWESLNESNIISELASSITTSSTTIILVDGSDFPSSGAVLIEGDVIDYTGRSSNVLTGVTNISRAHSSGDPVYSNDLNSGNPTHYNILGGELRLYPVPNTEYDLFNIYVTYYKKLDPTVFDWSVTDVPFFIAIIYYLAYKIYERKGKYDDADRFRGLYNQEIANAIRKESGGRRTALRPRIPVLVEHSFDEGN